MRRFIFAAAIVASAATRLGAQGAPARELLDFPIAAMAEPAALASAFAGGLWNPAMPARPGSRPAAGVAFLTSPIDLGVTAVSFGAQGRLPFGLHGGATLVHASVGDLVRTDTDPTSLGEEIPYHTTLVALSAARRLGAWSVGTGLRARTARELDRRGESASLDVGAVADRPMGLPVRLALSTFLLGGNRKERGLVLAAADARLAGRDSIWESRAGLSTSLGDGAAREDYLFTSLRGWRAEVRGGVARHSAYGYRTTRLRLGLGLHVARYSVGIAREESGAGLGASYQFLLTKATR